jgi:hypothetical protein
MSQSRIFPSFYFTSEYAIFCFSHLFQYLSSFLVCRISLCIIHIHVSNFFFYYVSCTFPSFFPSTYLWRIFSSFFTSKYDIFSLIRVYLSFFFTSGYCRFCLNINFWIWHNFLIAYIFVFLLNFYAFPFTFNHVYFWRLSLLLRLFLLYHTYFAFILHFWIRHKFFFFFLQCWIPKSLTLKTQESYYPLYFDVTVIFNTTEVWLWISLCPSVLTED